MTELIIITLSITFGCNILAGLGSYLVLYTELLKPFRIQSRKYRKNVFWKRFPLIAFNLSTLFILAAIGLYFSFPLFDMNWQSPMSIGLQLLFLVVIDDAYFYFFHRTLHTSPYLYDRIHKIHHRAYAPFPLEYIYVHPLEWTLGGLGIPIGLSIICLSTGSISAHAFWMFALWRNFHEFDIHSGLRSTVGSLLPFYGTTEHHDRHHQKNTNGNYASTFTYWDQLLGTDLPRK
jgi:sterol desaturase/sphingolipid hydroxylase (fatty acid hydroxylase superfamily)